MTRGYLDGLSDTRDELPVSMGNHSACYRHGWMNGRDDRLHKPRASAAELRAMARTAEMMDSF